MRRALAWMNLTWALCLPAQPNLTADLDAAVEEAVRAGQIPGAVLLAGRGGRIVHRKAYGLRALAPSREPMTVETIFDAASLTKVVATTPAVMRLFEQGKLRLNDEVTKYLPEFQDGRSQITVRHLLTHFSGLRPDVDLEPEWSGYEKGVALALSDKPVAGPGERFIYSDINFILLGEIVRRVSGHLLPEFVRQEVWDKLGMRTTMFQPARRLRLRIAPTEHLEGRPEPLRGIVHDPTTRYMGGVAGHAGMFTTADDLARFAEMMLGEGQRAGVRIFSPLTVRKFTTPQSPADQPVLRGLGWDIDSRHSANRGELFPIGSFGHTGFTGTSMWMDPASKAYVILLSNSVHPRIRPAISSLRARVATIAAGGADYRAPGIAITGYNETMIHARRVVERNGHTLTGLDVLAARNFDALRDKSVGLITNHTGLDREGRRNVDVMVDAGLKLKALFSPEHGIAGSEEQEQIGHGADQATGIPVWSLYLGGQRRPTEEMLAGIDVLVFDIQDMGARFYTYLCTMVYAMEEAARRDIPIVVLDRPNPLTGVHVEGPLLDPELESFVGCMTLPLRHGMTAGEIATMANAERGIGAKLEVVRMEGWERGDWFDSTGLIWVNPSPNLRSLNASLLYPGLAMLEYSRNYSVGRGTDSPFEQIGADWVRGTELAAYLNDRRIPGVRFYPTRFRPRSSSLAEQELEGVRAVITAREQLPVFRLGVEVAAALERLYPGRMDLGVNARLIGSQSVIEALRAGKDPRLIAEEEAQRLEEFRERRDRFLLYRSGKTTD